MSAARPILRIAVLAFGAVLALLAMFGILLAEAALNPPRRPLAAVPLPGRVEDVEIRGSDGARLRAWYVTPEAGTGRAILLHHGVGDNRLGMTPFARMLLPWGFSVLMVDGRGHGESGGEVSYGAREAGDMALWVDWLRRERRHEAVFGLGESMGAAILLESLPRGAALEAVVAESPFSSFREIAYDRLGQVFGLDHRAGRTILATALTAGMLYARLRSGFDFEQISPRDAVRRSRVPVLLIHGAADDNIPLRHSRLIAEGAPPHVVLWEVPEAPHTRAYATRPREFEQRVLEFFDRRAPAAQP